MNQILWGAVLVLGFLLLWLLDRYRGRSSEAGRKVLSEVEKGRSPRSCSLGSRQLGPFSSRSSGSDRLEAAHRDLDLGGFAYG